MNAIFCQALAGSPLRPQRLAQLDKEREEQLKPPFSAAAETREVRRVRKDDRGRGGKRVLSVPADTCLNYIFDVLQEEASPVREEAFTSTHKPMTVGGQSQVTVGTTHISRLTDDQLIKEFLSGSYCLHGVRHVHL